MAKEENFAAASESSTPQRNVVGRGTTKRVVARRGARPSTDTGQQKVNTPHHVTNCPEVYGSYSSSLGPVRQQSRTIDVSALTNEHRVISEQVVESEVKVPKKIIREEMREKVYVIPEKHQFEEVVEDIVRVRERIVEVAKPVIREKIVEIPEIEYVEKIVEVPETVIQERIVQVPKIEYVERVKRVPKVVYREKIIEVPEVEYREVDVPRIVEVPEIREEVVVREVIVDQVVEVPVTEHKTVQVDSAVERYLPVPVEAITFYEFRLPQMNPKYNTRTYPIYAPRFIEVPIPLTAINDEQMSEVCIAHESVQTLCHTAVPSMCDVEKVAEHIKTRNYDFRFEKSLLENKFAEGKFVH